MQASATPSAWFPNCYLMTDRYRTRSAPSENKKAIRSPHWLAQTILAIQSISPIASVRGG